MIDIKDYRRALSNFPTVVTIVTAFDGDQKPWGLTANYLHPFHSIHPSFRFALPRRGGFSKHFRNHLGLR